MHKRPLNKGMKKASSISHTDIESVPVDTSISNGPNLYHIGNEIGRGGFGIVYQAFNASTGQTVAVKRFLLHSIDKESLSSIEAEVELMQKLNHPNVVKYYDSIRTKSHLYIVLEFMENGSLASVVKKFGFLQEPVIAIYTTQVLQGLKYLHEQGVLHRDIKGANILLSKDGTIKLADFGVAMKLSDAHAEDSVVGSPYWLAPEIIEMSAPTSACDIWSVGCIVIELLTSKPPYFELEPMAALFRIVTNNDYPPLPEGISQALRDFLLLCFQKEPAMRSSASKLLEHPWLHNSLKQPTIIRQTSNYLKSRSMDQSSQPEQGQEQADNVFASSVKSYQLGLQPTAMIATPPQQGLIKTTSSASLMGQGLIKTTSSASLTSNTNAANNVSTTPSASVNKRPHSLRSTTHSKKAPDSISIRWNSNSNSGNFSGSNNGESHKDGDSNNNSYNNSNNNNYGTMRSTASSEDKQVSPPSAYFSYLMKPNGTGEESYSVGTGVGIKETTSAYSLDDGSCPLSSYSEDSNDDIDMYHTNSSWNRTVHAQSFSVESPSPLLNNNNNNNYQGNNNNNSSSSGGNDDTAVSAIDKHYTKNNDSTSSEKYKGINSSSSNSSDKSKIRSTDNNTNSSDKLGNSRHFISISTPEGSTSSRPSSRAQQLLPLGMSLTPIVTQFDMKDDDDAAAVGFDRRHLTRGGGGGGGGSSSSSSSSSMDIIEHLKLRRKTVSSADLFKIPHQEQDLLSFEFFDDAVSSLQAQPISYQQQRMSSSSSVLSPRHKGTGVDLSKYEENDDDAVVDHYFDTTAISRSLLPSIQKSANTYTNLNLSKYQDREEDELQDFYFDIQLPHNNNNNNNNNYQGNNSDNDTYTDLSDIVKSYQSDARQLNDYASTMIIASAASADASASKLLSSTTADSVDADGNRSKTMSITSNNGSVDKDDSNTTPRTTETMNLRKILLRSSIKDAMEDGFDEFINYQFDEKDFKRDEQKDLNFRKSREIISAMSEINATQDVLTIRSLCMQLIRLFNEQDGRVDHFITHHGVMPIMDMFDNFIRNSNDNSKILYVMRVVNTIIDGSSKAQEQLSLVGIIPIVMTLFGRSPSTSTSDNRSNSSEYAFGEQLLLHHHHHHHPYPPPPPPALSGKGSKLSSRFPSLDVLDEDGDGDGVDSEGAGCIVFHDVSTAASMIDTIDDAMDDDTDDADADDARPVKKPRIDPLTVEAARFIYKISSTSSLTLQMLIGAGGLSVLTNMITFGATLDLKEYLRPDVTVLSSSSSSSSSSFPLEQKAFTAQAGTSHINSSDIIINNVKDDGIINNGHRSISVDDDRHSSHHATSITTNHPVDEAKVGLKFKKIETAAADDDDDASRHHHQNHDHDQGQEDDDDIIDDDSIEFRLISSSGNIDALFLSDADADVVEQLKLELPDNDDDDGDGDDDDDGEDDVKRDGGGRLKKGLDMNDLDNVDDHNGNGVDHSDGNENDNENHDNDNNNDYDGHATDEEDAGQDASNRMMVFQMGVDCIDNVFTVTSSRTRDFCRLFLKLGLLLPLAESFQRILDLYLINLRGYVMIMDDDDDGSGVGTLNHIAANTTVSAFTDRHVVGSLDSSLSGVLNTPAATTTTTAVGGAILTGARLTGTTSTGAALTNRVGIVYNSMDNSNLKDDGKLATLSSSLNSTLGGSIGDNSKQPQHRSPTNHLSSFSIFTKLDYDSNYECRYSSLIADLLFKFSRSDSIVADTMARPEQGVLPVILRVLKTPELMMNQSQRGGSNSSFLVPSSSSSSSMTEQRGGLIPESPRVFQVPSHDNLVAIGTGSYYKSSVFEFINIKSIASNIAPSSSHAIVPAKTPRSKNSMAHPANKYIDIVELLLKCLKNLSMELSTLPNLESAGVTETLLPLLNSPMSHRYKNHILPCMFNICRIDKKRQEHAAVLGIVPQLKKIINENSPLRQFALPMLFDLAHTSNITRSELMKHDCVPFFLDFLIENYWQSFALNSLSTWLAFDDTNKVSALLIQTPHLIKLIEFFDKASLLTIQALHRPLLDMLQKSTELCTALGGSNKHTAALIRRLRVTKEAIVLRSLLKIMQLVHKHHVTPALWVTENKLFDLIQGFTKIETQVLVCELANKLLVEFKSIA